MTTNKTPLSLPSDRWDAIDEPFNGDVLKRQRLAQQLTGYVERLRDGAVIALDAPWGEGKTWFARHWAAQLCREHYRVAHIDAFENDYVEDPFLLLAAEVRRLSAANASLAERLGSEAAKVGKALMPMVAKMTINLIGKTVGTEDLAGEWSEQVTKAGEKGADAAQAWVKRSIEQHDKERNSMRAFRRELEAFAKGDEDKPVVIVIDELDRCRPAFAVRLLERIKHYFDVPNLVFVLVMNRQQLEMAIKGVYGVDTDAATYLSKFLNLSLALPNPRSWRIEDIGHPMKQFVGTVLHRFKYQSADDALAYAVTFWASVFELSLRDVERVCALYFLSGRTWPGLVTFLAALKVKRPALFEGFRRDDNEAYVQTTQLIQAVIGRISAPQPTADFLVHCLRSVNELLEKAQSHPPEAAQWLTDGHDFLFGEASPSRMSHLRAFHDVVQALDFEVQ